MANGNGKPTFWYYFKMGAALTMGAGVVSMGLGAAAYIATKVMEKAGASGAAGSIFGTSQPAIDMRRGYGALPNGASYANGTSYTAAQGAAQRATT